MFIWTFSKFNVHVNTERTKIVEIGFKHVTATRHFAACRCYRYYCATVERLMTKSGFYKSYVCLMQRNIHTNWWLTTGSHTESDDSYPAARTQYWVCCIIQSVEEDNTPLLSFKGSIVSSFSVLSVFYLLTCSKLSFHLVSYLLFALTVSRRFMNFKLNLQRALQILWYWFKIDFVGLNSTYWHFILPRSWIHLYSVFQFAMRADAK